MASYSSLAAWPSNGIRASPSSIRGRAGQTRFRVFVREDEEPSDPTYLGGHRQDAGPTGLRAGAANGNLTGCIAGADPTYPPPPLAGVGGGVWCGGPGRSAPPRVSRGRTAKNVARTAPRWRAAEAAQNARRVSETHRVRSPSEGARPRARGRNLPPPWRAFGHRRGTSPPPGRPPWGLQVRGRETVERGQDTASQRHVAQT